MKRIEETWKDIGMKVRPMRRHVYVRTAAYIGKIGKIYLPGGNYSGFYSGLAHQRLVKATVCAVGPRVKGVKPGETIIFQRLFFIKHLSIDDGTFVGWVDEENVIGYAPEDIDLAYIGDMVSVGSQPPVAPLSR